MRIGILLPVYNDWNCLGTLLSEIDRTLAIGNLTASIIILNDGGTSMPAQSAFLKNSYSQIVDFRILELLRNLGNQAALSVGLSFMRDEVACDVVVVMDADGQDRPAHILDLVAAHRAAPDNLVVAERSERSEGLPFRVCYLLYRYAFRLLTGGRIRFGNFSLIPKSHLVRLTNMAELPFHFAATLIKSRVPITAVPCPRDPRYDGVSSQNLVGLVVHAINGLSVFSEVVLVRVSLYAAALLVASLVAVAVITAIRLLTDIWIMGYATTTIGLLMLATGQALILSLIGIFIRAQRPISLAIDSRQYLALIERSTRLPCTTGSNAAS